MGDHSPSVHFHLDRLSRTFFSGEEVTGAVTVKGGGGGGGGGGQSSGVLLLELRGEVLTPDYSARQERHRTHGHHGHRASKAQVEEQEEEDKTKDLPSVDVFYSEEQPLADEGEEDHAKLPFSFQLPRDAPSSYTPPDFSDYDDVPVAYRERNYFCVVRWLLCLHLKKEEAEEEAEEGQRHDYSHFVFIHVNRLVDLNRADLPSGKAAFKEDVQGWSGLNLQVEVPRTKLVCGDPLVVRVQADNSGYGTAFLSFNLYSKVSKMETFANWKRCCLGGHTRAASFKDRMLGRKKKKVPPTHEEGEKCETTIGLGLESESGGGVEAEEVRSGESRSIEWWARVPPMPPSCPGPMEESQVAHWVTVEAEADSLPAYCCCLSNFCRTASAVVRVPVVVGNIPLVEEMGEYRRAKSASSGALTKGLRKELLEAYPDLNTILDLKKNKHYLVTPWFYYHRKKRRNETGVSTETVQEEHHKSKVEVPVAKDEGITKKAQIVSEEPK